MVRSKLIFNSKKNHPGWRDLNQRLHLQELITKKNDAEGRVRSCVAARQRRRYGVLITPPLLYYPTCHMLCIGEMAKRHFKLVSRYISSLSVFNIYTSTSTTPMSTTPYLHSPSSYLTQYQFKHHRCVHSHQLHTTRETTEDRIKWMEANITSNHICERIQVIFQTLHLDVTKHQKNAFDSLKSNFGFSLVKDKSTVANAGNGEVPLLSSPSLCFLFFYPFFLSFLFPFH